MRTLLIVALVPLLCTGCGQLGSSLRTAGMAGSGAVLGNKLSNGNPYATIGGAAGGVLLSEGIEAWKTSSEHKAYDTGFHKGRSDGIKQIYWNLQQNQRGK